MEEFLKSFGKLYDKVLSLQKNEDYIVNEEQMKKFAKVCEFFKNETDESKSKLEIEIEPKIEHGGITAKFIVFDIYGDKMTKFQEIVQYLSAMTIDATIDSEVCISVTVPNIFVHK